MNRVITQKASICTLLAAIACIVGSHAALAAAPAFLEFVSGEVTVSDRHNQMRAAAKGMELAEGDSAITGDGRAQIRFSDGGYFSLQPQSHLRIDEYRYSGKPEDGDRVFLSLLKGSLRTISGLIGKRNRAAYRMSTAVATIGIRGTEYVLELNAVLYGHVAQGAVEVCNAAGCLIVPGGQAFFVAAPSSLPVFTEKRAMLSPRPRELATVTSKIGAAAGSGSEAAPHHNDRPEQSQPTEPAGADAAGSANLMRPGSVRVHGAGADAPPVTPQPGRDASAMSEEPGSSARQANNAGTFAVTQGSNSGPGAGGPPNRGVPPGASNDAPQSPPGNPSLPSVARSLSSALGVLNAASLNGGAPAQFPGAGNGVGNGPPR